MNLPPFNNEGLLPPGDYELTLDELRHSVLVEKTTFVPDNWDGDWRLHLTTNLDHGKAALERRHHKNLR